MPNLLLIDDDKEVLSINMRYLIKEGYHVKAATNALSGIKILKEYKPDCIVLDVMMPGVDGFVACKKFKSLTKAPIIFLTGCSFEEDKIKGLLLGADDYIVKPYSLRELSARIQVQIRRSLQTAADKTSISYPPLYLDIVKHKAYHNSDEIYLSNREYELLYLLASRPNEIITFDDIGKTFWGECSEADRRTIMVTASRLRKKLEDYIGMAELIETVWSRGYKFVANYQEKII